MKPQGHLAHTIMCKTHNIKCVHATQTHLVLHQQTKHHFW